MVAQSHHPRQVPRRAPLGVFGRTPFPRADLSTVLQLVDACDLPSISHRLVYTIMALHADAGGILAARAGDIALHARLDINHVRFILRQLRAAGYISKIPTRQGMYSVWQLTALHESGHAAQRGA